MALEPNEVPDKPYVLDKVLDEYHQDMEIKERARKYLPHDHPAYPIDVPHDPSAPGRWRTELDSTRNDISGTPNASRFAKPDMAAQATGRLADQVGSAADALEREYPWFKESKQTKEFNPGPDAHAAFDWFAPHAAGEEKKEEPEAKQPSTFMEMVGRSEEALHAGHKQFIDRMYNDLKGFFDPRLDPEDIKQGLGTIGLIGGTSGTRGRPFDVVQGGGRTTPKGQDNLDAITGGRAIREKAIDIATETLVSALKSAKEGATEPGAGLSKESTGRVKEAASELTRQSKLLGEEHFEDMAKKPARWNELVEAMNQEKIPMAEATWEKILNDNPSFRDYFSSHPTTIKATSELDTHFEAFKEELTKEVSNEVAEEARAGFKLKEGGLALEDKLQGVAKDANARYNSILSRSGNSKEEAANNPLYNLYKEQHALAKRALGYMDSIKRLEAGRRELGTGPNAVDSGLVDGLKFYQQELNHVNTRIEFEKVQGSKGPSSVGAARTPKIDIHFDRNPGSMDLEEASMELEKVQSKIPHTEMGIERGRLLEREAHLQHVLDQFEGKTPKSAGAAATPKEQINYSLNPESTPRRITPNVRASTSPEAQAGREKGLEKAWEANRIAQEIRPDIKIAGHRLTQGHIDYLATMVERGYDNKTAVRYFNETFGSNLKAGNGYFNQLMKTLRSQRSGQ